MSARGAAVGRKRILLFGEGATLAHVARPLAVCQALAGEGHELVLACPAGFRWAVDETLCSWRALECQPAAEFSRRLRRGAPLYDYKTLLGYVEDDLEIIAATEPDLIVGDFRLSLAVSARRAGLPYIALGDAYWCEEELWPPPLPVLPALSWLPVSLAQAGFRLAAPLAFRVHAAPMERLRRHFGMQGLGGRLSTAYQDADRNLFANYPALFPRAGRSRNREFIGPLLWQMPSEPPDWTSRLPGRSECVFVTLGSSGAVELVHSIIAAVLAEGKAAIVATAGRVALSSDFDRGLFAADYLPGDLACESASLVISNGGSPTSQLALSHGVPVLGICSNMDQFLCMRALAASECGVQLRADRCTTRSMRVALGRVLSDERLRAGAGRIARSLSRAERRDRLIAAIAEIARA